MDHPLIEAIAAQAIKRITDFSSQNLANTAWSMARLGVKHPPLMDAISQAVMNRLADFSPFDLSISVWAFDVLGQGEVAASFLPKAANVFLTGFADDDSFGMFWFDVANVVRSQLGVDAPQGFNDRFEKDHFMPVVQALKSLSSNDGQHASSHAEWQAHVDASQLPYLGPVYTEIALKAFGVTVA